MSNTAAETQPTPIKKNRRWVWYFTILAGLTILAIIILIAFNLSQQLTSHQLQQAQKLWQDKRPKSYELHYLTRRTGATKPDFFEVRVIQDMVVSVKLNDLPLKYEQLKNHSMTALLEDIKKFMEYDAEAGRPWTFTRALFDKTDGHLLWYVRRVMGSRERIEIEVKLFQHLPPTPTPKPEGKNSAQNNAN